MLARDDVSQIEIIRAAVKCSDCVLLDRQVDHGKSSSEALKVITYNKDQHHCYGNVPITSVLSLGRADFWESGQSWRQIMLDGYLHENGLTGKGWQPGIFEYFEGELREKSFPASGSVGPLKLLSYGGVVECESGNHRLVGAIGWLASKYGTEGILKKARLMHIPVEAVVIDQIGALYSEGYKLDVKRIYEGYIQIGISLRAFKGPNVLIMNYDGAGNCFSPPICLSSNYWGLALNNINQVFKYGKEAWFPLTPLCIETMINAKWTEMTQLEKTPWSK